MGNELTWLQKHDAALRVQWEQEQQANDVKRAEAAYHQGKEAGKAEERERIITFLKREIDCKSNLIPSLLECKSCPFVIDYDVGQECILQSLRTTTASQPGGDEG